MEEPYSFRRSDLLSPRSLIGIVGAFILFFVFVATGGVEWLVGLLLIILLFFKPFSGSNKITIASDGITYKTLYRKYFYSWDSIKEADIFDSAMPARFDLTTDTFSSKGYQGHMKIYIATREVLSPGWNFVGKDYLDFDYNYKAWEMICHYLGRTPGYDSL